MYAFDVSDFVGFGPRLRFLDVVRMSPRLTVAPEVPPEWLQEAKGHARVTTTKEDGICQRYLLAALESVQVDAETALLTQTRTVFMDYFPMWEIEMRFPPIQSVVSVTYTDYNNVIQTVDPTKYVVDIQGRPGIITPIFGAIWPIAKPIVNAVQVQFTCGLGSIELISPNAIVACYMKFASLYWNREMTESEEETYWRMLDRVRWRHD